MENLDNIICMKSTLFLELNDSSHEKMVLRAGSLTSVLKMERNNFETPKRAKNLNPKKEAPKTFQKCT